MKSEYNLEVQRHAKRDALIALFAVLFFIVVSSIFVAFGPIIPRISPINWSDLLDNARLWYWPIEKVLISIVPVIIVILAAKQRFASIGLHKTHLLPALRLGFMFSLIPLFFGILPRILYGAEFIGLGLFMIWFARIFFMAAAEDILFVGFLQTRLSGYFKSDKAALCLGAALFSLMHVPTWIINGNFQGLGIMLVVIIIIIWFIMHLAFVAVYRRYNSLVPVTVLHTLLNFMGWPGNHIWRFADEYRSIIETMTIPATPLFIVAVGVWVFVRYRRINKATE